MDVHEMLLALKELEARVARQDAIIAEHERRLRDIERELGIGRKGLAWWFDYSVQEDTNDG